MEKPIAQPLKLPKPLSNLEDCTSKEMRTVCIVVMGYNGQVSGESNINLKLKLFKMG